MQKENTKPAPGLTVESHVLAWADDDRQPDLPPQGDVVQSEELTEETFGENELVNGGVGPQPDEHRGNAQGGFKYEDLPRKEEELNDKGETK